jgi:double-strand break repair protein MRE11
MSGLLNYYGRTPESDNILVKPVLLQKGKTKLALYGLSNVRDERLWRTFRDGNVKFFQPSVQTGEWFNIMSVHQNHHAYGETNHLPEHFLPNFMDLIVWGHEHECKIDPVTNVELGFKVMQPGSSVATSLCKGESEAKHISIISVTGKEFTSEPIRLKSVRPFVTRDITMRDFKELKDLAHDADNKSRITGFLIKIVDELIAEANESWHQLHQDDNEEMDEDEGPPLPLVRLRIESTPPDGGKYDLENPQRFSGRFQGRVANSTDVVQFHKKRQIQKTTKIQPDMPEMQDLSLDGVKVDKLVKEFLSAQSLTVLPHNSFSDAVGQFVDKDDKHAMQEFLEESLASQQQNLMKGAGNAEDGDEDEVDVINEEKMMEIIESHRLRLEEKHASGEQRIRKKRGNLKPRPDHWDSDMEGPWEDSLQSIAVQEEGEEDDDDASVASAPVRPARGRGSRGGRGGKAAAGTTRKAPAAKKAPAKTTARGKKKAQTYEDEDEEEEEDVIMLDDDDEDDDDDDDALFVKPATKKAPAKAPAKSTRGRGSAAAGRSATQGTLNFASQSQTNSSSARSSARPKAVPKQRMQEPDDDEISDDDAFEPPPAAQRRTGRR